MRHARRGFSMTDLVVTIVLVLIIGLVVAGMIILGEARHAARSMYDGVQARSLQQSMVSWAGNHQDNFPLPSHIDLEDTIPGIDTQENPDRRFEKDVPRWILSLLLYAGFCAPSTFVSPAEVNQNIRYNESYEYTLPTAVAPAKRANAVLDPSFAAYPDEAGGDRPIAGRKGIAPKASMSYAMVPLVGARRAYWNASFDSKQVIVASRGPWYAQTEQHEWTLNGVDRRGAAAVLASQSNAVRLLGKRGGWKGNVVRNDGSVNFETRPDPETLPLMFVEPGTDKGRVVASRFDNIFANEDETSEKSVYSSTDDDITEATNSRRNSYLRCYGDRANRRFDEKTGQLVALRGFWYD